MLRYRQRSSGSPTAAEPSTARRKKAAQGGVAALVGAACVLLALRTVLNMLPAPLGIHSSCAEVPYVEMHARVPDAPGENAAEFRILQITDLHLTTGKACPQTAKKTPSRESGIAGLRGADRGRDFCADELSFKALEALAQAEDPDLVVFTGDTLFGGESSDPREVLRQLGRAMYSMGMRWTVLFGNHDAEGGLSKAAAAFIERTFETAVRKVTPPFHHVVRVLGPSAAADAMLFLLDVSDDGAWLSSVLSLGDHTAEVEEWLHLAGACARSGRLVQAKHFLEEEARPRASAAAGPPRSFADGASVPTPVPPTAVNVTMMHMPLLEYRGACAGPACVGTQGEEVCPAFRFKGLYGALSRQISPALIACGHDHLNDWCAPGPAPEAAPGAPPPLLCYGRSTGFDSYKPERFTPAGGFLHGARVIDLAWPRRPAPGAPPVALCTWKRLVNGTAIDRQCLAPAPAR
eukprot:tig00001525_g9232.t1